MAFGGQRRGSYYLDRSPSQLSATRTPRLRRLREFSPRKIFLQCSIVLMAFLVLGSGLQLSLLANSIQLASAAAEPTIGDTSKDGSAEANETMKQAMENAGFDPESESDMAKWSQQTRKPADGNSFDALFYRLFIPQYMNGTSSAISTTNSGRTAGCDAPEPGRGTIVYHNCDVPNISGEIVQDIVRFVVPTGAYGASQESAKVLAPSFGLPTGVLPGSGQVPISEGARSNKYTALELFGYNLNYTAYLGEWDYIKVFTEARAMSNFGVFDNLKLGGKAIIDGAVNAVGNSVDGWSSGWDAGGLAGAIGGFFSGAFEGAAAGGLKTILDTSDLNVFEQKAWYRPDFGSTTYGARSMNSSELSAESLKWMNSMMNFYEPEKGVLPEDFPDETPPPRPLEAISSCDVIAGRDGGTVAYGQRTTPPGVSETDCAAQGNSIKASLQADLDAETAAYNSGLEEGEPTRGPQYVTASAYSFNAEGTQAQESMESWSSTHSAHLAGMEKYGWSCSVPGEGSASDRASGLDAWYSCFSSNYAENEQKTLDKEKMDRNNEYTSSIFGQYAGVFAGWYAAQNQDQNFNAAYNRFVCVDPNTGKDITGSGGALARVYDANGNLTGNCPAIRAPIQNGLFGNGYVAGQDIPGQDTRRASFSPMESIGTALGNTAAGMSLDISIFATQLSNTILGLAFTPVLDALGIRDIIVSLIESLRDSLFMPLAVLFAAFGAITILWKAVRSNAYAQGFASFLYIVVAFLLAVVILTKPAATLKAIDEAPILVENTILSAMFGDSADDQLCTATGSAGGTGAGGTQIDGSAGFNPNASIRILMCENWRTFAFTPWVFGQWGTGYENLYANGYAPSDGAALSNSNQSLVGNAGVNFGAGQVVHNWAAYQLAVTSVGTSTTADPSRPTGVVNKNFYRIVDAQMGPNGGAGTDPTYAQSWSNFNGDTAAAMFLGPVAAIMGAVVVIGYTIAKLELVLMSIFLLVLLPIMLLLGIHPTFGRQKLKAYAGTLVGLMIQRILLTVLIGLLFKFLFSISASGAPYLIVAIISIVVSAIFIGYRKELLGLVQKTMDEAAGSFAGGRLYNARQEIAGRIPAGVRNFASMQKQEAKGLAFGTVAAMRHGQLPGEMKRSLTNVANSYKQREAASQMMAGLPGVQKFKRVAGEIDQKLDADFNQGKRYADARDEILEKSGQKGARINDKGEIVTLIYQRSEDAPEGTASRGGYAVDKDGNRIVVGERTQSKSLASNKSINGRATRRSMGKYNELQAKIKKLEDKKTTRLVKGEKRALDKMGYGNIDELQGERRVEAQAARARVHLELTRHSKRDGRDLDADGGPRSSDRVGTKIERKIAATSEASNAAIERGIASDRTAPQAERRAEQARAYGELKDLMEKAAKDTDQALKISARINTAADALDRKTRALEEKAKAVRERARESKRRKSDSAERATENTEQRSRIEDSDERRGR